MARTISAARWSVTRRLLLDLLGAAENVAGMGFVAELAAGLFDGSLVVVNGIRPDGLWKCVTGKFGRVRLSHVLLLARCIWLGALGC
jgi:hypothetical protein